MKPDICDCPNCICELDDAAVREGDRYFCCQACAQGHPEDRQCKDPECPCADRGKVKKAQERQLDHSLEETFPASDPISP